MIDSISLSIFKISLGKSIFHIDKNINDLPLDNTVRIIWNNGTQVRMDGVLVNYIIINNLATQELIDDIYDHAPKKYNKLRRKKQLEEIKDKNEIEIKPDSVLNENAPITEIESKKIADKLTKEAQNSVEIKNKIKEFKRYEKIIEKSKLAEIKDN